MGEELVVVVAAIVLIVTVWLWIQDLRESHGYDWAAAKRRLRRGGLNEPTPERERTTREQRLPRP